MYEGAYYKEGKYIMFKRSKFMKVRLKIVLLTLVILFFGSNVYGEEIKDAEVSAIGRTGEVISGITILNNKGEVWTIKNEGHRFIEAINIKKIVGMHYGMIYLHENGTIFIQSGKHHTSLIDPKKIRDYKQGSAPEIPLKYEGLQGIVDITANRNGIVALDKNGHIHYFYGEGREFKDIGKYDVEKILETDFYSDYIGVQLKNNEMLLFNDGKFKQVKSRNIKLDNAKINYNILFTMERNKLKYYECQDLMDNKTYGKSIRFKEDIKDINFQEIKQYFNKGNKYVAYVVFKDNKLKKVQREEWNCEEDSIVQIDTNVKRIVSSDYIMGAIERQIIYEKTNGELYTINGVEGFIASEELVPDKPYKITPDEKMFTVIDEHRRYPLEAIATNGKTYVVVGEEIIYSHDTENFKKAKHDNKLTDFRGVFWDGEYFVAYGGIKKKYCTEDKFGVITRSKNGVNWRQNQIFDGSIRDCYYDKAKETYFILTSEGLIFRSKDFSKWEKVYEHVNQVPYKYSNYDDWSRILNNDDETMGKFYCFYKVKDRYFAVGNKLLTSYDGANWKETKINLPTKHKYTKYFFREVKKHEGRYYGIINFATEDSSEIKNGYGRSMVVRSTDGINWHIAPEFGDEYNGTRNRLPHIEYFAVKGEELIYNERSYNWDAAHDSIWTGKEWIDVGGATGRVVKGERDLYNKYDENHRFNKETTIREDINERVVEEVMFKGNKLTFTTRSMYVNDSVKSFNPYDYDDRFTDKYDCRVTTYYQEEDYFLISVEMQSKFWHQPFLHRGFMMYSTDGVNWTEIDIELFLPKETYSVVYDIIKIDGVYYAVGAQGLIVSSEDGIDWRTHKEPEQRYVYYAGIAEFKGKIFLGGAYLEYTTDMEEFTRITSPQGFISNLFVMKDVLYAVAEGGIYYTHDGVQWYLSDEDFKWCYEGRILNGVYYNSGKYIIFREQEKSRKHLDFIR